MNKIKLTLKFSIVIAFAFLTSCNFNGKANVDNLKDALQDNFLIGVALNTWQTNGTDSIADAVVTKHFNSIVAENCMKSERIQPQEGVFYFDKADEFVAYGEKNGMFIIGHCLVWHSQAPEWFFVDSLGNDVSRDVMIERMKNHISTLVGRYKGRVDGWDVVNEAFNEDGTLRDSKFLQIIGEDYIQLAFEFAHQADPDAELYYNDYNMYKPEKCDGVIQLVKSLQERNVRIDAIGMQAHIGLTSPTIEEYQASIDKVSAIGLQTMFTELDISVIPWPSGQVTADISTNFELQQEYNPYPDALPDSLSNALNDRYESLFGLFIENSDKISRVTTWGLSDANTWRNNWPIRGRSDYPLLFDRKYQPKLAVEKIIELAK